MAGALVVVALVARIVISGYGALSRGEEALAAGDELSAALELREAMTWELPLAAPWQEEAAEGLWTLHEGQVQRGDVPGAVQTLTLLRGGLFGSRSVFGLGLSEDWRVRTDGALAPLMARWEADSARLEGRPLPGSLEERAAHFAETLTWDAMPSRGFGVLAVLGFFLWVGFGWRAAGHHGRRRWMALGVSVAGLALFLGGVGLA